MEVTSMKIPLLCQGEQCQSYSDVCKSVATHFPEAHGSSATRPLTSVLCASNTLHNLCTGHNSAHAFIGCVNRITPYADVRWSALHMRKMGCGSFCMPPEHMFQCTSMNLWIELCGMTFKLFSCRETEVASYQYPCISVRARIDFSLLEHHKSDFRGAENASEFLSIFIIFFL